MAVGNQQVDGSVYNFTTVPGEGYGDNGQARRLSFSSRPGSPSRSRSRAGFTAASIRTSGPTSGGSAAASIPTETVTSVRALEAIAGSGTLARISI